MVIRLGLNRSLPRYLYGNSGSVRRERRRASNTGRRNLFSPDHLQDGYGCGYKSPSLYRSPTRYLVCSSGSVRFRRASNTVGKEPSLVQRNARFAGPHAPDTAMGAAPCAGDYGMMFLAISGFGVGVVRVPELSLIHI